jgi:L-ascorbate metabolism protein UlaG (beta-lactamase superfamily)
MTPQTSALIAGGLFAGAFAAGYAVARSLSARGYRGPRSDHFDGERFHNLHPVADKSLYDLFRWQLSADPGEWEWREVTPAVPASRVEGDELVVTMVNHATTLIQTQGLNILTDPIWSRRCSPFQWVGPARYHDPGIRFDDLPPIDVVLVSHNHYDHLDVETLRALSRVHAPRIFAGLGNREFLQERGVDGATDIDWWESVEISPGIRLTGVPVQHWSTRTRLDLRKTLWLGFVLETPSGNIYFPGDTGFASHFELVRERFGSFRLALLPIGACLPRWFMKDNHLSPADAVKAFAAIGAEHAIPIHYGTFALGDDGQDYAIEDLRKIAGEEFLILGAGESARLPAPSSSVRSAPGRPASGHRGTTTEGGGENPPGHLPPNPRGS